MINLTDNAATQLSKLHTDNAIEGQHLRIHVAAGGCSGFEYGMSFGEKKDDDQLFENNGVKFLIDPTSLEYLNGSTIDFNDGLSGKGFEISNPNAQNSCGCGRSFN